MSDRDLNRASGVEAATTTTIFALSRIGLKEEIFASDSDTTSDDCFKSTVAISVSRRKKNEYI